MKIERKNKNFFVLNMFLFFIMGRFYTKRGYFARGGEERD
jgi:hypothetical protein